MKSYNNDFWDWVNKHCNDDPTRLRLNKKPTDATWIDDAISQIENKRRSRQKFLTNSDITLIPCLMPVNISVEQASSARIAKLHSEIAGIQSGKKTRILDMTCGLGVDASFMARYIDTHLTALDLDPKIATVAAYNFADRPNIEIINGDSVEYLKNTKEQFNLIFIDPARRDNTGCRVYNLHDCIPDVTALLPLMLEKSNKVMIKMSPMLDVTQTLRDLPGTQQLYIVDERGECRELLAVIDHKQCENPLITVWHDGEKLSFTQPQEYDATASIDMPTIGQYLLEPSPALMKAAPFKLLCQRFDAAMIHPNTHLYVTDTIPSGFPGKTYKIIDVVPYSSGNLKRITKQRLNADVAVRNFPISADALRVRLGIKKSGDTRITGITANDGKQYLLFLMNL